jgi:dTDP-4-dehydrorhamnose 3,5-epimerase-like enzyme
MRYPIDAVQLIKLPYDFAENGDLVVIEGKVHIPFAIARVFVVRGFAGAVRGQHAHKACSQFLTCPYGGVEVLCDDGREVATFVLDKADVGLLIPPSIWTQQSYLIANSVLTVLCDRPYEQDDYIRDYDDYKIYRDAVEDSSYGEKI